MSGQKLMKGLSYIDERYIAEAEEPLDLSRTRIPFRLGLAAACLCLALLTVWKFPISNSSDTLLNDVETGDSARKDAAIAYEDNAHPVEVPSVILRVSQWTEDGFIGTVAQLTDTDIFSVDATLTVIFDEEMRIDQAKSMDSKEYTNSISDDAQYFLVLFTAFDEENGTIVAESISPVNTLR